MPKSLKLFITLLVAGGALALLATSFVIPVDPAIAIQFDADPNATSQVEVLAGIAFWTVVTLFVSAFPVRLTDGVQIAVSTAPLMAATALGGPTAGAWVALLGTTDSREVRGKV